MPKRDSGADDDDGQHDALIDPGDRQADGETPGQAEAGSGDRRPRRSDQRPTTGLRHASTSAETANVAAIPSAPQPSASSWSGARTERVPKRSGRQHQQPHPGEHRTLPKRDEHEAKRLALLRRRRRRSEREHRERRREHCHSAERCEAAEVDRGRSQHRSEQRADDGCRHRDADRLPAAFVRRRVHQPREGAGPAERAGDALCKPGQIEEPVVGDDPEEHAGDGDESQAESDRRLDAQPRGDEPARDGAEHAAERVRRDEQPGLRLREVELLGEARQERREGREEDRVDEDDGAGEREQAAHEGDAIQRCTTAQTASLDTAPSDTKRREGRCGL